MRIPKIVHAVRQNHALEHATMHMLSRRHPHAQLMGRSTPSGFVIYGQVPAQAIADAAAEALTRLQRGESELAVHPRCGTNLAVTSTLAGTAAFAATLGRPRSKLDRLPLALIAATLAALVAQPLAYRIQENITTTPEVDGLYISAVLPRRQGRLVSYKVIVGRR